MPNTNICRLFEFCRLFTWGIDDKKVIDDRFLNRRQKFVLRELSPTRFTVPGDGYPWRRGAAFLSCGPASFFVAEMAAAIPGGSR